MNLFIITINYNSSENTIGLLKSLENQTDKSFEIIVVDNNSDDVGKLMEHKTTETNIIYIKNDKNLGYSGGNNVGINRALNPPAGGGADPAYNGASWVLLLNNDKWVENNFISRLRTILKGKEGILGIALNEGDKTAYSGKLEWFKPTLKHNGNPSTGDSPNVYVIGGAMLIHKKVFEKIGLLDENYFLYFEDADFSIRAKKADIPISFIGNVSVHHSVSSSTKKLGSPMILRYHYRNALYFNLKNGPWYIKLLVWLWGWFIAVKQVMKIFTGKNREQSIAILKGIGDWYICKMGKIT